MVSVVPGATVAENSFIDLSGTDVPSSDNPYDALIAACCDDAKQVQAKYHTHRTKRNEQQKEKLTASNFPGVTIDQILLRCMDPTVEPGYADPRHCLVFWARPPKKLKILVSQVQQKLVSIAPHLWLMPLDKLHMTALEITHSLTEEEIAKIVDIIRPKIPEITDYTFTHRARLVKPILAFDNAAVALSFLPAAGEAESGHGLQNDAYTYHHLRRDLYNLCTDAGVKVASRYVVPSSHLTVGRFIESIDFDTRSSTTTEKINDPSKMRVWCEKIEEINQWLEEEYWPKACDEAIKDGGQWIVGEEKGLDCRFGTLWFGGGTTIRLGKGF